MSRSDRAEYERLVNALAALTNQELPAGIADGERAEVFIRQLVESLRRVRYLALVAERPCGPLFADPTGDAFDPLRAIVYFRDAGETDEAFWMAFLYVHFGRSRRWGWEYPRRIYGSLGQGLNWTWENVSQDVSIFRSWLDRHQQELSDGPGGFGNHRKYESLAGLSDQGTGAVVDSYVEWVCGFGSHDVLVNDLAGATAGDPSSAFEWLASSVKKAVVRFGRTASFDYVNLLSWMGLVPAVAGICHIAGSTGPRRGTELMFGAGESVADYEESLADLCEGLDVPFDVMEDALCNWQKSPDVFKPFRG